jgi:hypothetical protein
MMNSKVVMLGRATVLEINHLTTAIHKPSSEDRSTFNKSLKKKFDIPVFETSVSNSSDHSFCGDGDIQK